MYSTLVCIFNMCIKNIYYVKNFIGQLKAIRVFTQNKINEGIIDISLQFGWNKFHREGSLSQRQNTWERWKRVISRQWPSLNTSVDGGVQWMHRIISNLKSNSGKKSVWGFYAKNIVQKMKSSKVFEVLYSLKVMLSSLIALSKIFQTRAITILSIISNVLKTKTKLSWKTNLAMKDDLQERFKGS